MISEVFKSNLLTSSDFYKELKSKGNLLYGSTTKEDDLNKAYLSFIKSRVKKEFIDLYLADSGLKSKFEQIFKRHSFVYELNGNTLIEGRCNGKVCAILYAKNDLKLNDKVKIKSGLNAFSFKALKLSDDYYQSALRFSNIFDDIKVDAKFFELLVTKINREHIDSGKESRLKNGYSNESKGRSSLHRYYFILFNKYIVSRNFNRAQRSLLSTLNGRIFYLSHSYIELVSIILRLGNYPYLLERLHSFKAIYPFIYIGVNELIDQNLADFYSSSKEQEFLSHILNKMYGYHKNYLDYEFNLAEFNCDAVNGVKLFNFTKRHIDFIKRLTLTDIKMIMADHRGFSVGFYDFLIELNKLQQEQLPKNYFELCMLSKMVRYGLKVPNNLAAYCKPLYEKALYDLRDDTSLNYKNGKMYKKITKKGHLNFVSAEVASAEAVMLTKDYIDAIRNDLNLINKEDELSVKISEYFNSLIKSRSLKSLNDEAVIYHERINLIQMRRFEAINDYNLKNNITKDDKANYTFKAPSLLSVNEIDGVPVKQLRDENDLRFEGDFMCHCVCGYTTPVLRGDSIIFHIGDYKLKDVENMKDKSTVEIIYRYDSKSFIVIQHQTYRNQKFQRVTDEHTKIAEKLCSMLNEKYGSKWMLEKSKRNKETLFKNVMPKDTVQRNYISADGFINIYAPINGLSTLKKIANFVGSQLN